MRRILGVTTEIPKLSSNSLKSPTILLPNMYINNQLTYQLTGSQ